MDIPNGFYRTAIKALVLDEQNKFLLCREDNGYWDFPGGAMDFGESYKETLSREIKEEMGLTVIKIGEYPVYFITFLTLKKTWATNIFFETKLQNLEFTPSSECLEIRFFDKNSALKENVFSSVKDFLTKFDPNRHQRFK